MQSFVLLKNIDEMKQGIKIFWTFYLKAFFLSSLKQELNILIINLAYWKSIAYWKKNFFITLLTLILSILNILGIYGTTWTTCCAIKNANKKIPMMATELYHITIKY